MGPVTTNPWLIAIINMTIVFGVLIALGVLMSLIQVVDPTKKKADKPAAAVAPKAAAPVAAAAPAAKDNGEIIAVIAAAVAACGVSADQIASIHRIPSPAWTAAGKVDAISVRKDFY